MAKAIIFKENNDSFDAEREWMQRYGCVQIVEETVEHETLRPMWKQLMANLQRGDEIVISKFSNAAWFKRTGRVHRTMPYQNCTCHIHS